MCSVFIRFVSQIKNVVYAAITPLTVLLNQRDVSRLVIDAVKTVASISHFRATPRLYAERCRPTTGLLTTEEETVFTVKELLEDIYIYIPLYS